jgi:drug/metabolite transporter (DMT)-like permease
LSQTAAEQKRRSLLLVLFCTFIGAVAQLLIKSGAPQLNLQPTFLRSAIAIVFNVPLMAGLCMYGVSALLLVLALQHGELSMIYPVIALTFVWVTILSAVVIGEPMTPYKLAGIATIVAGVGILGLGKRA